VKGTLANGVDSQYSSHMVYLALLPLTGTPQLPVVDRTDAPHQFKWIHPFCQKMKSGFCACAITFQMQSTLNFIKY
jgi:hypothetical protein